MKQPTSKHIWAACLACVLACGPISAQETSEFDLSTQRSEKQSVLPVPGQKVDHGGLIINPTPQRLTLDEGSGVDLSKGVSLKKVPAAFAADLRFLTASKKGAGLSIDFGPKVAAARGVRAESGAYALRIDKRGISIVGYDERGAFYGIQTLRQIVASPVAAGGKLPALTIDDYPDLPFRGVVEGFYGTPWSHEVRISLIDFYGRYKMNTYLYGPKDDPYHSCPNWRLPYPEKEAANIRDLVNACVRNRVDFVWAIHPGQDIRWNEEDYQNLVNKFNWMYDLGVRSFAIFFDDISGEGTNPLKQTELLNRLNADFVKIKGDVTSLTVCPTDYSRLWANPTPQGSLALYGQTLDPSVKVFWTGDVVCSDLTPETMEWVNSRIKRPAYYWWNYPVTDYVRNIIMQGPVYGLDGSLDADDLCGIVSNPMEHGEASKLALYGVADYAWNVAAYNPMDNWERGLVELTPEAAGAYRTFAIHSCDTETGYRRDESWETRTFRVDEWTEADAKALWEEFDRVEKTPEAMENGCVNALLLKELRPWLAEFSKLGTRGKRTLELMERYRKGGEEAEFWARYAANRMTPEARSSYEAHKSGTMKLHPFYENAMNDMAHGFLKQLTGRVPMLYKGIGSFANIGTTLPQLMFDGDSISHYTSAAPQGAGDWIGVDLGSVRKVHSLSILQGRNSVDDVDYFDHAVVEYSADGRTWAPLTGELTRQYVIDWSGEPVQARYICLKRLESTRTNYASVRSFVVNPMRVETLGFRLEAADPQQALTAFDERISTSYVSRGTVAFEVPAAVKRYTLLTAPVAADGEAAPAMFRQFRADGSLAAETAIDAPFFRAELAEGVTEVRIDGPVELVEIIAGK